LCSVLAKEFNGLPGGQFVFAENPVGDAFGVLGKPERSHWPQPEIHGPGLALLNKHSGGAECGTLQMELVSHGVKVTVPQNPVGRLRGRCQPALQFLAAIPALGGFPAEPWGLTGSRPSDEAGCQHSEAVLRDGGVFADAGAGQVAGRRECLPPLRVAEFRAFLPEVLVSGGIAIQLRQFLK